MTYPSQPGGTEDRPGGWTEPTWSAPDPAQPFGAPAPHSTEPTQQFGAPAPHPTEPTRSFSAPPGDPYQASAPPGQQPYQSSAPPAESGSASQFGGQPVQPYQYPGYPAAGQPGAQPGYPYGYGTTPPPQQQTNSLALVSMILALVGFATCVTAPVGAILGHIALKQLRERGEGGEGMAKTGIIVGWILTGLLVLVLIGYGIAIAFAIRNSGSSGSGY